MIAEVVLLVPVALAIGWASARTLGIRQSWARTFTTGLVGWALGVGLANWSVVQQPDHEVALEVRVAAFSVLLTMAASLAVDFLARPGAPDRSPRLGRLPAPPHPVQRVRRATGPSRRFRQVLAIAREEGLLQPRFAAPGGIADPEFGARLRVTLERCGGMFIKFGQAASTRTDLLPAQLISELTKLQSSVPPVGAEAIRGVLEADLGRTTEQVFSAFEWVPLAAASIGQVHLATLLSGERVAVKIQRPHVAETVARDSDAMVALARFIQRRTAFGLRMDVVTPVQEFTEAVKTELDFSQEARAAARIGMNRINDQGIHVPEMHLGLCTPRVMVSEEVHGRPLSDSGALAASAVPREELADRLLGSYLGQILHDGVFHADPHPGNLLLDTDGTLHMLDFGSTGILDAATLEGLAGALMAVTLSDRDILQRAVTGLAPPPPGTDLAQLNADLGRFLAIHAAETGGFDVQRLLGEMIAILERHRLPIPSSFTLLSRTLITLGGTLQIICPGYPLAERVRTMTVRLLPHIVPGAEQLQRELLRLLPALRNLPGHAESIAGQLRAGQLSVRTRSFAHPADVTFIRSLIDRILLAAVGLTGMLVSALLLLAFAGSTNRGDARILEAIGYTGLFLGTIITMRVVALILRDRARSEGHAGSGNPR